MALQRLVSPQFFRKPPEKDQTHSQVVQQKGDSDSPCWTIDSKTSTVGWKDSRWVPEASCGSPILMPG